MTDREKLEAFAADIPGDAASWQALANRGRQLRCTGRDGTVTVNTLQHVDRVVRAIGELAFVLASMERGDIVDDDIPF